MKRHFTLDDLKKFEEVQGDEKSLDTVWPVITGLIDGALRLSLEAEAALIKNKGELGPSGAPSEHGLDHLHHAPSSP